MSQSSRRPRLSREQKDALWRQALALAVQRGYAPAEPAGRYRALADPAFVKALIGEQAHAFVGTQCATCSAPAPYLRVVPATDACWEFYYLFLRRAASAAEVDLFLCLKSMILLARQGQIGHQDTWEATDYVIASRDDVLRTGLRSTCHKCGESVFTSTPYPATVSRICEECFLVAPDASSEEQAP